MPDRSNLSWALGVDALDDIVATAVGVLERGQTVVLPTDTVYGVAAHFARTEGIDRIFSLKGRDRSKPLAVLVADAQMAFELLDLSVLPSSSRDAVRAVVQHAWPGDLTIVGRRTQHCADVDLGGDNTTIGVRVPAAEVVRAIADQMGPLVTTSANRSGDPTPLHSEQAAQSLAGDVAMVIDGGPCDGVPSTVLDVTKDPFRILRQGACDVRACGLPASLLA